MHEAYISVNTPLIGGYGIPVQASVPRKSDLDTADKGEES
jgi:hypothetical protein